MSIVQPSMTFTVKKKVKKYNNVNSDYAIQFFFKNNKRVGRKSKYKMSELAHHLMVEGQYSKNWVRRGASSKALFKIGETKRGKNILEEERSTKKKKWNVFERLYKDRQHALSRLRWSNKIKEAAKIVVERREMGVRATVYNQLRSVGKVVKSDIIDVWKGMVEPPLDPQTIRKKKGRGGILRETNKLIKSLNYKVVPITRHTKTWASNLKLKGGTMSFVKSYMENSIEDNFKNVDRTLNPKN